MLTIYAWVVAVMSLPFMLLTSQMERRKLLICLFVLFIASHVLSFLAWNFTVLVISRQVKVLALAPDATDVAMALFSGIFNIGIGAGALVGNQVSLHWSMSAIGYIGAIPACAALVWAVLIFRKWPVTLEEQPH